MIILKRTFIALIIFAAIFTCACQPTPESNIVVGNNTNVKDRGPTYVIDELVIPETWVESDIKNSKACSISANAHITVPDISQCCGVVVQRVCFDKEMIQAVAENFVEDMSQIYIKDVELTKREIMEMIVDYEIQLAEGIEEGSPLLADINAILESLYARLETAPETKQQGILNLNAISNNEEYVGEFTFKGRTMIISGIMNGASINIKPQGIIQYDGWDLGDKVLRIDDIGIDEQAAILGANAFLRGIPGDSLAWIHTKKAQIVEINTGSTMPIYEVSYGKTYNGLSTVDIGTNFTTYPTTSASDYAAPWPQEVICIYVSSDGVIGLSWNGPSKTEYIEEKECEMLSFEHIQKRIREQIRYRYSYLDGEMYSDIDTIDICIDEIKLGYCIAGIKDNTEQSRLVPAWYVLYREYAEEDGSGTEAVMVLHAETGALMDPRIIL